MDGPANCVLRAATSGDLSASAGIGALCWRDVLEMLEGRSTLVGMDCPRPNHLDTRDQQHIFVERPRRRRAPNSDKWYNSGGKRGSTVYGLDGQVGIRKKYGKFTPCDGGPAERFAEFTLIDAHANPQNDSSVVVFVMDIAAEACSNQANVGRVQDSDSSAAAAGETYGEHARGGSARSKTQPRAVLDVRVEEPSSAFISFQMNETQMSTHAHSPGMSIELGAIVMQKSGEGIKLESQQGDFAEWHRKCRGEPDLEEGDVVGFDSRGQISRRTNGAHLVGVVSRKAVVEGSAPPATERGEFDTVAYVGVVPVKVARRQVSGGDCTSRTGPRAGDLLLPSGRNDGTAIVAPTSTPPESPSVGVVLQDTEWNATNGLGYQRVTVVVTAPSATASRTKTLRRLFWMVLGALLGLSLIVALLKFSTQVNNHSEIAAAEVLQQCKADFDETVHCRLTSKTMQCGFIADLEKTVRWASAKDSNSWLSGSPSPGTLSVLTNVCKARATAAIATRRSHCSSAMVEAVCRQHFVPLAVQIGVCAVAANSRGLSLGGAGYAFVGNYTRSSGCFTSRKGTFSRMAFFSLRINVSMTSGDNNILPLRRWHPIRSSRVSTSVSCTSSCPQGFRLHTSIKSSRTICEIDLQADKCRRMNATGGRNVTDASKLPLCLEFYTNQTEFPHLLCPAREVSNMDQTERHRWAAHCNFRWDECQGIAMAREAGVFSSWWGSRQSAEQIVGLRVQGANSFSALPSTIDGDYLRVEWRCNEFPVYQLGGSGGRYAIYWPAHASYWLLGKSEHLGDCNHSYETKNYQYIRVVHNASIWPAAPSSDSWTDNIYDDWTINHEIVTSPVPITPLLTYLFDSGPRHTSAQVTEILCDPNDLCCGVDCGGAGQCHAGVCTFCDDKQCGSGQCLSEYSGEGCTFASAYVIRGSNISNVKAPWPNESLDHVDYGPNGLNGVYVKIEREFCAGAPVYRRLGTKAFGGLFLFRAVDIHGAWVVASRHPSLRVQNSASFSCSGNTVDILASSGGHPADAQGLPLACTGSASAETGGAWISDGVPSVQHLIYPGCHYTNSTSNHPETQQLYSGGDCVGSPDAAGCVGKWAERALGQRSLYLSTQMSVVAVDSTLAAQTSFQIDYFWCYGVDCGKHGRCGKDTLGACECATLYSGPRCDVLCSGTQPHCTEILP